MNGTHRPDHEHNPPLDMAAIRARLAARSPEESATRKAGLDALRVGEDAMALGEQHLADGDLQRAREFFAMAARYRAADAEAMLRTVDALLDATRDPEITATMAGIALDGERADSRAERDLSAHRAWETAELLRGIEGHAAQAAEADRRTQAVLALALTAAAQTLSTAQAKADGIVAAAENRAARVVGDSEQDSPMVGGEPGMGKSSLLDAALADLGIDSRRVRQYRLLVPSVDILPVLHGVAQAHEAAVGSLTDLHARWFTPEPSAPRMLLPHLRADWAKIGNSLADGGLHLWGSYARRIRLTTVTEANRDHGETSLHSARHVGNDHWRLVLSCPTDRRGDREDVLAEVRAALVRCFGTPDAEDVARSELRLEWEVAH